MTKHFFEEHEGECTPVHPCKNCRATEFLQIHLKRDRFTEFLSMLGVEPGEAETPFLGPIDLEMKLKDTSLPKKISSVLEYYQGASEKVITVADLVNLTEAQFLNLQYVGPATLRDTKAFLDRHGLNFKEEKSAET